MSIDLSAEEISELRSSLRFDRDRVGMPGCAVRRRAEWLLTLMDLADSFAVEAKEPRCLRCQGSGIETP